MVKHLENLQCVGFEDYTNKKGESMVLNHYRTNLGYVIKVKGSEKRDVGTFYPIVISLGTTFKEKRQYWSYSEFNPEQDLKTEEA